MVKVRVGLDWSPNTLHAGFLVAMGLDWYKEAHIEMELVSPEEDQYHTTPMKKLINESVHLAIAPTESVISYHTLREQFPVVAIAAITQYDTSSIATLPKYGISRPAFMDGKIYGSYHARFEDHIIRQMIVNDGGHGLLRIEYPPKLDMWEYLMQGKIHSTWVFEHWEGVIAEMSGIDVTHFRLRDFGIPYGYSPLIVTSPFLLKTYKSDFHQLMEITARGYEYAAAYPEKAAKVISKNALHPNLTHTALIAESLKKLAPAFVNEQREWGRMKQEVWLDFMHWLDKNELVHDLDGQIALPVAPLEPWLYTNEYLPAKVGQPS